MRKTRITIFLALAAVLLTTAAVANVANITAGTSAFADDETVQATDSAAEKHTTEEADMPDESIVDEVIWVVGDEPILKS